MFLSTEIVSSFAKKRNTELSFSYLKENGELLSIAASSGLKLEPAALELYRDFYENAYETCLFFPQFFRFTLAIVLDLEDLGFKGNMGQKLCKHVREQAYLDYETSDARRLEILTLVVRRQQDEPLAARYRQHLTRSVDNFISKPDHFVRFNKPLFYDLTHIIFFLTNYGQNSSGLQNCPMECIENIGVLALLDNDSDLLAEICICIRFLGKTPPAYWEQYVETTLSNIQITFDYEERILKTSTTDQYHTYFVNSWLMALKGRPCFTQNFRLGTPYFSFAPKKRSLLSVLSENLYATLLTKTKTRSECLGALLKLSDAHQHLLGDALTTCPQTAHLLTKYSQGIFNADNLPA